MAALIVSTAPHHGRVTSNFGQNRVYTVKAGSSSPRARRLRIFATTKNPNRLRMGHWSKCQGMALRLVEFLAVMLTALALVHLAALPNKMAMAQAAYFVAQQIYAGWALFGIVLFVANLAHTIVLRELDRSFGYALASFLLSSSGPSRQIKRPTTGPFRRSSAPPPWNRWFADSPPSGRRSGVDHRGEQ